jgi:hypothetical protein
MKRLLGYIVAIVLLCLVGLQLSSADMISPGPVIPKRPESEQQAHRPTYPAYAIAAGGVAVTLTGSLIALRVIRKRNGNGPS